MRYFKVLSASGGAHHGGIGKWHLPKGKRPGKWMPPIEGDLVPCENGYHLCRPDDLLVWLGPRIFVSEYRGEMVADDNKIVVREARLLRETDWNERSARLFACDCAERVLPIFEKEYPDDKRPREAIRVARLFARGEATAAAWDAARAAAWDAARAAAWAAAWAAAGDAARAAAWAAAGDAAWAAAGDAAWAAAGAAAGDAAWAAAGDAEKKWQRRRLMAYLDGKGGA